MDRHMRLRLHVRRNGLPEEHILFNVPLANDPTVATLLELVNDTILLEDEDGEWGLDDYVVELHAKAPLSSHAPATAFECLHFQPIAGLLEKDDEVFIRPLTSIDLKKRRLGGRHQILPGGEHIVDGVPFGRPRLRSPRGRPPVAIAPRKRRRLLGNQEYDLDAFNEDQDAQDLADDDYQDPSADRQDRRLLTRHGDEPWKPCRSVRFSASARTAPHYQHDDDVAGADEERRQREDQNDSAQHTDQDDGDQDSDQDEGDQDSDQEMAEPDLQELANEAADLQRDLRDDGQDLPRTRTRSRSRPTAARHQEQACDRIVADQASPFEATPPAQPAAAQRSLNSFMAVKYAFPRVPEDKCWKLLDKHNMDPSHVHTALSKTFRPRHSLARTMVYATELHRPEEIQLISSPARSPAEAPGDISRIGVDEETESSSDGDENASDGSNHSSVDQQSEGSSAAAVAAESDMDDGSDVSSEFVSAPPHPSREEAADDSSINGTSSSSSSSDESDKEPGSMRSSQKQAKTAKTQARSSHGPRSSEGASSDSSDASDSCSEEERPALNRKSGRGRKTIESPSVSSARTPSAKNNTKAKAVATKSSSDDDSSASSSDSSSDSSLDSESESDKENTTPVAKVQPSRIMVPPKKSPARGAQLGTPRQAVMVPPGQGLSKTQKRNRRRRMEKQSKQSAAQDPNGVPTHMDTDLEAKKKALLQTLATGATVPSHGVGKASDDVQMAEQPPDAWKEKISYRGVECVQEGVALSQPPFPFVQRWDPQQRWDAQPNQRIGKRKFRADSQFYNEQVSQNAKKRRSRRAGEGLSHEDDTTFPATQEDIKLNYDDVSFHPDGDPMSNTCNSQKSRAVQEPIADDLPPLPEDMASLAELQARDAKVGTVIAWKQLLCNEATQWQPLLSEYLTASITKLDESGEGYQVKLAKRDRTVDRAERKYDEETGQRIYGKFEIPDEDEGEDAEEDHGFRDVFFDDMIQPRIVQQPPETDGGHTSSENPTEHDFPKRPEPDFGAPELPKLGFEVANSQPEHTNHFQDSSDKRTKSLDHTNTLDSEQGPGQEPNPPDAMDMDATETDGPVEESFIPDTAHDQANSPVEGMSITEGRRGEIDELIKEGGFRAEVRSSIDQSDFLNFEAGSPSRQLAEEYAHSLLPSNHSDVSSTSSEAPSEYNAKEPVKGIARQRIVDKDFEPAQPPQAPFKLEVHTSLDQNVSQLPQEADADTFHSAPQTPSPAQMCSDRLNEEDSTRLTTPTGQHSDGRVEYPRLNASQTTESTELSGRRQFDPNFVPHSDDLGNHSCLAVESSMMHDLDDDCAAVVNDSTILSQAERPGTPTQPTYNDDLVAAKVPHTPPTKARRGEAKLISSPDSLASSESELPDIMFVGSQVAANKFNETPRLKKERASDAAARASVPNNRPGGFSNDGSNSPATRQPSPSPALPSTTGKENGSHQASFSPKPQDGVSPSRPRRVTRSTTGKTESSSDSKARPKDASCPSSISPPVRSRSRHKQGASSDAQALNEVSVALSPSRSSSFPEQIPDLVPGHCLHDIKKTSQGSHFGNPTGSQVVSLLSSDEEEDVEPKPEEDEPGPEYSEMYAEDDIDSDYVVDRISSTTPQKKAADRRSMAQQLRAKPRVNVAAVVDSKDKTPSTTVSPSKGIRGSQGRSDKPSGRYGKRW